MLKWLLLPILLLTLWACESSDTSQPTEELPPNVIFILADDLGYGDLSCYGQTKFETPNLDRLAANGLRFTDHYAGTTVCSPSRAVLLTGQHMGHVKVRGNRPGETSLDTAMTILPELFKQAGYATGAFGKWGVGQPYEAGAANPLNQGFDTFFGWKSQTIAHSYYPPTMVEDGGEFKVDSGTYVHDLVMGKAFNFVRKYGQKGEPFFCYLPVTIPHASMHAPPALHQQWREKLPQFDTIVATYGHGGPAVRNPIAAFPAMVQHLDAQIGDLIALLDSLGQLDNTLVLFASDNGAHREGGHDPDFWNSTGGLRGIKRDLYEGGIRSPLIAYWPAKISGGDTSQHISAFYDFVPTFADLLGQPVPEQSDGLSMLPILTGKEQPSHDFLYWEFHAGITRPGQQAVRMGKWKGVRRDILNGNLAIELYDLSQDPTETEDIAAEHTEIVARMEEIMAQEHETPSYEPWQMPAIE